MRFVFALLLILAALTLQTVALSDTTPDNPAAYSVLIEEKLTEKKSNYGSGFFLNKGGFLFLVTARHVLFDEKALIRPFPLLSDNATLVSYSNDPKENKRNVTKLNLKALNEAGYVQSSDHDVAVVKIATLTEQGSTLRTEGLPGVIFDNGSNLTAIPDNLLKKFDDVIIGGDAIIFGYPVTIGLKGYPQIDYFRPLMRKGLIAGVNATNRNNRTIILDCPVNHGNSGGTVVEVEHTFTGNKYKLIGLVSQYIPYLNEDNFDLPSNPKYDNSGYSVIVPIDYALDLLK